MPSSLKELESLAADWARWGVAGYRGLSPEEGARRRLGELDEAFGRLSALPFAASLRVFGSSVDHPDLVPGDIDVFLDLGTVADAGAAAGSMLGLAKDLFPLLDPFLRDASGALWCRSEAAYPRDLRWTRARGIRPERIAGVPLSEFTADYVARFAEEASPPAP